MPSAIVTGAGGPTGIGFATARRLHTRGTSLVITSTTDRIADRARELGPAVRWIAADLTVVADAERVVALAEDSFGGLDVLVNNAGITAVSDPDEAAAIGTITDAQWHKSMAQSGHRAAMTRAAVPNLSPPGPGGSSTSPRCPAR